MKSLRIYAADGRVLATIVWSYGEAMVASCFSSLMKQDLERWTRDGLQEWVGSGLDASFRTTSASDPKFLARLARYLERQYDFRSEIEDLSSGVPVYTKGACPFHGDANGWQSTKATQFQFLVFVAPHGLLEKAPAPNVATVNWTCQATGYLDAAANEQGPSQAAPKRSAEPERFVADTLLEA